ncbi:hypothetical protein C5B42_01295 [Candidatus Cerribacteria bacterium 'Amazon FNV 2010 28 9']|uniref:DNA mismatch repair protein MutL n=1 Tax=Candidatus Cerribacteria bacterium 'Amazon FNV 2010 28 9' TaxID=2081795 RepID=A0A317JUV4_9BACT|nr:MAG: hypothetical protein C5B42_01295 [Candidatus Cerribacteria bacterium 'Amazon FNV 2010 28 9']
MGIIHTLSESVISAIAAGEVIERPAFVVKELIENAIDARANHIRVLLKKGGIEQIIVADNGSGMTKEDLLLSWKLHTTSKITNEEDLSTVTTLGFRGEALSSIAASSSLTIESRHEECVEGWRLQIKNSELIEATPIGMPIGTKIIVDRLFANIPARKKTLKNEKTELRHCIDQFISLALAYPALHFTLIHNGKDVFDLPSNQLFVERVKTVLGSSTADSLLQLTYEHSYCTIRGFITSPVISSISSSRQLFFINGRPIHDKLLTQALKDAFGTLLEIHSHPLCVLALTIPRELIDVNVHPKKDSVRFVQPTLMYEIVSNAILSTLRDHSYIRQHTLQALNTIEGKPMTQSILGRELQSRVAPIKELQHIDWTGSFSQLHRLFIVAPTTDGIILIDQHAAHERILFEQFTNALKQTQEHVQSTQLQQPLLFSLSSSEMLLFEDIKQHLLVMGFDIEPFEGKTFSLRAIPSFFEDRDCITVLHELLDTALSDLPLHAVDRYTYRMLTFLACKSAIKAGDSLSVPQQKKILRDLFACEQPYTCPHGRPTAVEFSKRQLYTMFKREK